MKTFKTAGVSKLNGKFALRATNREGDTYKEILLKEGHTDVHMTHLKQAMGKDEARKYLAGLKAYQQPDILAVLKAPAGEEAKETKASKEQITKPAASKAPKKPKKAGGSKKDKKAPAATENDGSEVATADVSGDEDVDVGSELGIPAFAKHVDTES